MANHTFFCIDAHTCGNPVRVVAGGAPAIEGANMSEVRQNFVAEFDWIRTGLMFEPRGHDIMSGSILYPSTRDDCDTAILFIETSGCLPMCGHGTIGTVTVAIEQGLVTPKQPGHLNLDTPAGVVRATYEMTGNHVESVTITNVPSFLHSRGLKVDVPTLGQLTLDVAYGGNFYAIIEAQDLYTDLDDLSANEILRLSPIIRKAINQANTFVHPKDASISKVSHVQWTGKARHVDANSRNAVFYGDKAIDRSPCGTGTSARMAQLSARGDLQLGQSFVHESIIGSLFTGQIVAQTTVGKYQAIIPTISGWARITGLNTLFINDRDPFAHGFQLD